MANITADMVKELREKTGVGMMDCKRALVESNGDMNLAVEHLRKAGIAKAEKKAGRAAKEGKIACCIQGNVGVLVELLCETDFAANSDRFKAFALTVAERVAKEFSGENVQPPTVAEQAKADLTDLVNVIGENMQIRRVLRWETTGKLTSYNHQMNGKIVVLSETSGEAPADVATDICMHIAAFSPRYIDAEDVPAEVLAKEKEIAAAQVEGKPANIVDKIVQGKIGKWYSEVCLLRQPWVRDDKTCLAKVAPKLKVHRFVRWQVGEEA